MGATDAAERGQGAGTAAAFTREEVLAQRVPSVLLFVRCGRLWASGETLAFGPKAAANRLLAEDRPPHSRVGYLPSYVRGERGGRSPQA
jgi:hypothetical protein